MFSALLLAGATAAASPEPEPRPHSLTAAIVGCSCLGSGEHDNDGGGRGVVGVRAQYDYALAGGARIGLSGAYESVSRDLATRNTSVFMFGPVVSMMGGDEIRGGIRLSGGVAYAYDPRWNGVESSNVHVSGFFVDISGELAVRVTPRTEFVLDTSIFNMRSFGLGKGPADSPTFTRWWYGMAVLPLMASLGVRVVL